MTQTEKVNLEVALILSLIRDQIPVLVGGVVAITVDVRGVGSISFSTL